MNVCRWCGVVNKRCSWLCHALGFTVERGTFVVSEADHKFCSLFWSGIKPTSEQYARYDRIRDTAPRRDNYVLRDRLLFSRKSHAVGGTP